MFYVIWNFTKSWSPFQKVTSLRRTSLTSESPHALLSPLTFVVVTFSTISISAQTWDDFILPVGMVMPRDCHVEIHILSIMIVFLFILLGYYLDFFLKLTNRGRFH